MFKKMGLENKNPGLFFDCSCREKGYNKRCFGRDKTVIQNGGLGYVWTWDTGVNLDFSYSFASFGAAKLPGLGKAIGKTISEFKKGIKDTDSEPTKEEKKEEKPQIPDKK